MVLFGIVILLEGVEFTGLQDWLDSLANGENQAFESTGIGSIVVDTGTLFR